MRRIQVGDTKILTVKDERKRRPELSQLPLRSSGQMWSPWAQGKRLIRGCKRQTELKETQQQHLILFLVYPVQGVMLNICFVGCGIKPKLENISPSSAVPCTHPQSSGSTVCSVHLVGSSRLLVDTVQSFDLILRLLGLVLSQSF